MPFPHHLFKAYDIRGVAGDELSVALVENIGRALASEARDCGSGEFVVARDGRLSGAELSAALIRGLTASGCDVVDIGMAPTPVLYFAAGSGSGVQVTASHNPPADNGMKMLIAGVTLFGARIQTLKQRILDQNFYTPRTAGRVTTRDALPEYTEKLCADITLAKPLKVAIDCGNGVAGVLAPALFRRLGCEVVELFCEVDGNFPNHHADPSDSANMRDLIATVREHHADLGIAFDGDGDRLGVVSADGDLIAPDRQMLLFVEDILAKHPGGEIVFDVKCSRLLARAIEAHGGVASMCKTGHSFIKDKLRSSGAVFAGEMSGHLFSNERWGGFDDALYAAARLCELLARAPDSAAVFAALPDTVNTPELKIAMAEGEAHTLVEELLGVADAHFTDADISQIDGLRVDFTHGFGLVRASNTTPTLVLRFEADNAAHLESIQNRFRALLHALRPELSLPF